MADMYELDQPTLAVTLGAVRAIHYAEPVAQGPDYCAECEHRWPCLTASTIYAVLGDVGAEVDNG